MVTTPSYADMLIQHSPEILIAADTHRRITEFNQAAERAFGYRREEVLGQPVNLLYAEPGEDVQVYQRTCAGGFIGAVHNRRKNGEVFPTWLSATVLRGPTGQPLGVMGISRLIRAEEHAELIRREARSRLTSQSPVHSLIGQSPGMKQVYQQIGKIAQVDANVVISGETGTGKEVVARAIHTASVRKDKPFVAVNCGGLSESLIASQLFGHKRGAFTGAVADQVGFFEAAHGGTLLLDEIGELPLSVQATLLRVLQEHEIIRIGESHSRKINVRVLAATHRTLSDEVAKGTFRADLLYRLRVARIHLPPLRERREDIPLLVDAFLAQQRMSPAGAAPVVSADALRRLAVYSWPGNVRELKNALEYATIHYTGGLIHVSDLPPEIADGVWPSASLSASSSLFTEDDEHARIHTVLKQTRGNRAAAARLLGIGRATFYRRLAMLQRNQSLDS